MTHTFRYMNIGLSEDIRHLKMAGEFDAAKNEFDHKRERQNQQSHPYPCFCKSKG